MKPTVLLRMLPTTFALLPHSRRSRHAKCILALIIAFFTTALASAVTPDRRLLALVPPAVQMVAGISDPPRRGQPSTFLLITHSNIIDLDDFTALSGVDSSHFMDQFIMVASDRDGAAFAEHSLIASGHFNQSLIYKSATNSGVGALTIEYRGARVLKVQPLARERDSFHDVRWLAIMDSNLALFGTSAMVQQELDRYLDGRAVDSSFASKLAHLRRDDATWCVATLPDQNLEIQSILQLLDSRLADFLRAGDTIRFGIRFGRQVEFEFEVDKPSSSDEVVQRYLDRSSPEAGKSSLLPVADLVRLDSGIRGTLKISKASYESWITEVLGTQARLHADPNS